MNRYLQGRDPIGVQFAAGYPQPNPHNLVTIVGVADDIRQRSVEAEAEPAFYRSLTQIPARRMTMVVATSLEDPTPVMAAIREEVRKADPQIAVDFELVDDFVASTISRQQLGMTLDDHLRARRRPARGDRHLRRRRLRRVTATR